jgi:hypothetical protein
VKDYTSEENVCEAMLEARLEIQRRIKLRQSVLENRENVLKFFFPSLHFGQNFDSHYQPNFIDASEWSKLNQNVPGIPPSGKYSIQLISDPKASGMGDILKGPISISGFIISSFEIVKSISIIIISKFYR